MFKVVKRDGEEAAFDIGKITNAIEKAFKATDKQFNTDIIELLGLRVTADFQSKIKDSLIDVESVQDSVETVLEQSGYSDVAKAYILYRKQREKIRNMKSTILDYKDIVDSYEGRGLAGKGEFHRDLLRRRSDLKQLRCCDSQLLAV